MTEQTHAKLLRYVYKLSFDNGDEKEFEILLDEASLELQSDNNEPKPDWTKLKYSQCENCPLSDSVQYCPIAVNLSRLVSSFADAASYEAALVTVESPQRTYVKKTTLQKALSAIIGIYMVTSNCPVMDKLRPMTRFHLPFANSLETFFRSISSYLVAQFLLKTKGTEPDWELKGLREIYKQVNVVNKGMSQRLLNATKTDANVNAVVILHSFGDGISYFIDNGLADIEPMFDVFLKGDKDSFAGSVPPN
ncbi:MAG: hypothetical protein FJ217_13995 [Ignavibacteria bacterium]|nr:hypothetical protein [Ignavibacteria bacterium]